MSGTKEETKVRITSWRMQREWPRLSDHPRRGYTKANGPFCRWCKSRNLYPLNATIPELTSLFRLLKEEKDLSPSAMLGYRAASNQFFSLGGKDSARFKHLSMLLQGFRKSTSPLSNKMPEWDIQPVLQDLCRAPYEPLQTASFSNLTLKTVFLLALASAKRVGEIHALTTDIRHSKGWISISLHFEDSFIAKTQKPDQFHPKFHSFQLPAPQQEPPTSATLLCPVRALREYLKWSKYTRGQCQKLLVNPVKRNVPIAKSTISFWLREVIITALLRKKATVPK